MPRVSLFPKGLSPYSEPLPVTMVGVFCAKVAVPPEILSTKSDVAIFPFPFAVEKTGSENSRLIFSLKLFLIEVNKEAVLSLRYA